MFPFLILFTIPVLILLILSLLLLVNRNSDKIIFCKILDWHKSPIKIDIESGIGRCPRCDKLI